jgi:hypothetical protein
MNVKKLYRPISSFSEADQSSLYWSLEKEGADMLDPIKHCAVQDLKPFLGI